MSAACEQQKVNIRLPDGYRENLKSMAKENGRSLNSELVFIIKNYLLHCEKTPTAATIGVSKLSTSKQGI
ncbi:Arc family DNA-binding protein [Citrobacter freundii]|nr:Arc family DNA-binding protein [Citrobacter freundii]